MANRQIAEDTLMDEDEINLLDYWRVLVKRKLLIGIIVGAAVAGSIIYNLTLPLKSALYSFRRYHKI